mmetsp:Transcript_170343/g.541026  ORF Transcript_170343/g.541026 Transcript_170343/m.541026 type:complete len:147 (-) Transcript_170343:22-462(-)
MRACPSHTDRHCLPPQSSSNRTGHAATCSGSSCANSSWFKHVAGSKSGGLKPGNTFGFRALPAQRPALGGGGATADAALLPSLGGAPRINLPPEVDAVAVVVVVVVLVGVRFRFGGMWARHPPGGWVARRGVGTIKGKATYGRVLL